MNHPSRQEEHLRPWLHRESLSVTGPALTRRVLAGAVVLLSALALVAMGGRTQASAAATSRMTVSYSGHILNVTLGRGGKRLHLTIGGSAVHVIAGSRIRVQGLTRSPRAHAQQIDGRTAMISAPAAVREVRISGASISRPVLICGAHFHPAVGLRIVADGSIEVGKGLDTSKPLTLVSAHGAISAQPGVALRAHELVLSAASGIGASGTPLQVATSRLSAHAGSGSVYIRNSSGLTVAGPDGVRVDGHGGVQLATSGMLHVAGPVVSHGGTIVLSADSFSIHNTVSASSTGAVVLRQAGSAARPIELGSASSTTLGLTAAELGRIHTDVLRVGRADNHGDIVVTRPLSLNSLHFSTLSLVTGGAVRQSVEGISLTGSAVALRTGDGINLTSQVSRMAFHNTGGAVVIENHGGTIISRLDGLRTSWNMGLETTFVEHSPFTFAVNFTSAGTITTTTTETASEATTPLPPPDDDITVSSGVTVESTGGDVDFTAADSVVLRSTSLVKSDTGNVSFSAGVGDVDSDAAIALDGNISAGQSAMISSPSTVSGSGSVGATNLALSASTGIGSASSMLNTAVGKVVARTATGGIFISNTGALAIGYAGEPLQGATVTGTSGDISISASGSIVVTTNGDIVKGPAAVTVDATGAASDVLTGGANGSGVSGTGAIVSTGGTVSVSAGRDILVGDTAEGSSGYGDVQGGGSIQLNAGRDIVVDEASYADAHGAGTVTATAGRNISVLQTDAQGARITSEGGAISLSTGATDVFTLNGGGSSTVATTQNGGNGPITISADDMVIDNSVNAGTSTITLRQATTTTRNIDLGLGTTSGDLGISDTELGRLTASTVTIGRADNAGNILISSAITAHAGFSNLTLDSAGTILADGGSVTTSGGQTYNAPVSLGADTTLTSTGSGAITLNGAIDGVQRLTVNTAGATTFGGAVGAITPLTSLVTDAPGTANLNGGSVKTTGLQTYNDPVTLGTDTTVTSTGGTITFGSTVDGAYGLTVAGAGSFSANVGGVTPLTSLVLASGSLDIPSSVTVHTGSFTLQSGTATLDGTLVVSGGAGESSGTLTGSGTIDGNLSVTSGAVNPGDGVGTLTVSGTYSQGSGATLNIDIQGTTPGTQYDQLKVSGAATLGGTLNVIKGASFTIPPGSSYLPVTYGSHSGTFGAVTNAGPLQVHYLSTAVELVAPGAITITPHAASCTAGTSCTRTVAYITDSDSDPCSNFTATVTSWGDGSSAGTPATVLAPAGSTATGTGCAIQVTHTYLFPGDRTLGLSVADADSTSRTGTATITVTGASSSTPGLSVIASASASACGSSDNLALGVHVSSAGTPSGTMSFQDRAHGVTLTGFHVTSASHGGSSGTAVVYGTAMQNGASVTVRVDLTASGAARCSGSIRVRTSAGYDSGVVSPTAASISGG